MKFLRRLFHRPYFLLYILYALLAICALIAAIWFPRAFFPLAAAERGFALFAAVFTALSPEREESKTAKLLLIALLPFWGSLFAFTLLAPKTQPQKSVHRFCSMPLPFPAGCAPEEADSAAFYAVGRDFLSPYLHDLKGAKTCIYMEYYIVAMGKFWNELEEVLTEKAREGVKIKLLFDDFGCAFTLPNRFINRLKSKKIEAKFACKMRGSPKSANLRDHRKLTVIDGKIVYLGGLNLADEYIGEKVRFGHWKDSAIRLTGAIAAPFEQEFLREFHGERAPAQNEQTGAQEAQKEACNAAPVFDGAFSALLKGFAFTAQTRIYLTTPYLAPDKQTETALCRAAESGTDVRILIPHIPDKRAVFLLSRHNGRRLRKKGIQVMEYTAGFLHAKNAICDTSLAYVGSHNLDYRSLCVQKECGVLLESEKITEEIARDFCAMWEESTPLPKETLLRKISGEFLRLFTPLL